MPDIGLAPKQFVGAIASSLSNALLDIVPKNQEISAILMSVPLGVLFFIFATSGAAITPPDSVQDLISRLSSDVASGKAAPMSSRSGLIVQ